jgi:hypothetical protein
MSSFHGTIDLSGVAAEVNTALQQALSTPTIAVNETQTSPSSGLQIGTNRIPWPIVIAIGYAVLKLGIFKRQLRMLSTASAGRR